MLKIHMTRQFFEATALRVTFSKKQKKTCYQISSEGVGVPNFRDVPFFVWSIPYRPTHIRNFDIFHLNFLICGKAIEKMCGNPCDGPVHSDQQPSRSLFRRIYVYSQGDMWKFTGCGSFSSASVLKKRFYTLLGNLCTKLQAAIVFCLVSELGTNKLR